MRRKKSNKNKKKKTGPRPVLNNTNHQPNYDPSEIDLNQVEFHRHGLALVPDPSDKRPGVAYFLKGSPRKSDIRLCSCSIAKKQTCPHVLELLRLKASVSRPLGVSGDREMASLLNRVLELRPAQPLQELKGMASTLKQP